MNSELPLDACSTPAVAWEQAQAALLRGNEAGHRQWFSRWTDLRRLARAAAGLPGRQVGEQAGEAHRIESPSVPDESCADALIALRHNLQNVIELAAVRTDPETCRLLRGCAERASLLVAALEESLIAALRRASAAVVETSSAAGVVSDETEGRDTPGPAPQGAARSEETDDAPAPEAFDSSPPAAPKEEMPMLAIP